MRHFRFYITVIIFIVTFLFCSALTYALPNNEIDNIHIEELKYKIENLEKQLDAYVKNSTQLVSNDKLNLTEKSLSSEIALLKNDVDNIEKVMIEKYDSKIEILGWLQSGLNFIGIAGALILGLYGVNSFNEYRGKLVKEKLESITKEDLIRETTQQIKENVLQDMYKKYSSDFEKINLRFKELEQFEPVIKVLKEMKKNG